LPTTAIALSVPAEPFGVVAGKSVDVTLTVTRTAYDRAFEVRPAGASAGAAVPPTTLVEANATSVSFAVTTEANAKHGIRNVPIAAFDVSSGEVLWTGNLPLLVRGVSGSLDTSYGIDGYGGAALDFGTASALQSDGKVVVVGGSTQAPAGGRLARFDAMGALDPSFGDQGIVKTPLRGETNSQQWLAVTIDAMGRIVVVGTSYVGGGAAANQQTIVARFLPTGAPDNTFGIGGFSTIDIPAHDGEQASSVATVPDGSILVAGSYQLNAARRSFLIKVAPTGVRDAIFGVPEISLPYAASRIAALSIAGDRIYAAGGQLVGWFALDGAFKAGIELSTDFADPALTHLAQDKDRVIAAGSVFHNTTNTTLSARWLTSSAPTSPAFTLDVPWGSNSEGTHEEYLCDTSANGEHADGLVVQPDRKAVVMTAARNCATPDKLGVLLYRYLESGRRDLDFGTGGKAHVFLTGRDVYGLGIYWTPSSQLLAVSISTGRTELLRFWP